MNSLNTAGTFFIGVAFLFWSQTYSLANVDISYPAGYIPVGEDDRVVIRNDENLKKECPSFMSDVSTALLKSSPETYKSMMDNIKKLPPFLQKSVVQDMAFELQYQRYPKPCLQKENQNHPVCQKMTEHLKTQQARFFELLEMVYGSEVLNTTEAQALCFECEEGLMSKTYDELENLFKTLISLSQCEDPKSGEAKTINSGTGLGSYHRVRKEPDGSYSILLPLEFSADEDYDGDVPKDQVPSHYSKKVQECMNKANKKMLGPNGEKLTFITQAQAKPTNSCRKPGGKHITIGPKDMRSNAGKYEADIGCLTIVHEVLHLTGLCDEYKETLKGLYVDPDTKEIQGRTSNRFKDDKKEQYPSADFKLLYDCRLVDRGPNMMSEYRDRWGCAFPKDKMDEFWSEDFFESSCSEKHKKSLLNTAQFNAILYGTCPSKNKSFNECSQLAYQNQIEGAQCQRTKKYCEEQNAMGTKDKSKVLKRIQRFIADMENQIKRTRNALKHQELSPPSRPQPKAADPPRTDTIPDVNKPGLAVLVDDFEFVGNQPMENTGPGGLAPVTRVWTEDDLQKQLQTLKSLRKELQTVESWPE